MRTFVWEAKYALGEPDLDAQHRRLFVMLRELQLEIYGQVSPEFVVAKVNEMLAYFHEHITAEEALMEPFSAILPMYLEHKEQHAQFFAAVNVFASRAKTEGGDIAKELCEFLGSWLVAHIYTMDKKTFAAMHGLGFPCQVSSPELCLEYEDEASSRFPLWLQK